MEIYAISDTHSMHEKIQLPDNFKGDIIIHAGDACGWGDMNEIKKFFEWFRNLDFKYKIYTPGNHDKICETYTDLIKKIAKDMGIIFLCQELVEVESLKIFGYPYTPRFGYWSFMKPRGSSEAQRLVQQIPEDIDILVSHGPPRWILDFCGTYVGCDILRDEIFNRIKPKACVFGHIHESFGKEEIEGIKFYNVSICDGGYKPTRKPTRIFVGEKK